MKFLLSLTALLFSLCTVAAGKPLPLTIVKIPYMEREGVHRAYADALLKLALEMSKDKYGPYHIIQQGRQTVIRRQLVELEKGINLNVAVSMPMPDWLDKAQIVQFPIMKGLASYRLFLAHSHNQPLLAKVNSLEDLKQLAIGQGPGWSTGKILQDNAFQVIYGGPYSTLIPMLAANRFPLLMRGIYETEPELRIHKKTWPELIIVEDFGIYTYLPLYFFVAKNQPLLAQRLEYGLKQAYITGQLDQLFEQYFSNALKQLNHKKRKIFYLPNTNIDQSFFAKDKPYLLDAVIKMEEKHTQ